MREFTYRDLTTLEEFARSSNWSARSGGTGYDEVVPVPILAVTVHRGGVLIGAFDGDRMVGFVYSLPGIKHGKATQWSHMAGVVAEHRSAGLGQTLKLLQRDRTLAMGLDLIEWTYDPLQAMNAHLNFAKLGVVAEEYAENIYGESIEPAAPGQPDRSLRRRVVDPQAARRAPAGARRPAHAAGERCGRRLAGQPDRTVGPVAGVGRRRSLPRGAPARWWKFRWGSPRCWRAPPSSRWPGGSARARSSRPTSTAAIAPSTSSSIAKARKGAYLLTRN